MSFSIRQKISFNLGEKISIMIINSRFGLLLSQHLEQKDLTASWLARRLGVSPSTIFNWINANNLPSERGKIIDVADALALTSSERRELLEEAGYFYQEVKVDPDANKAIDDNTNPHLKQVLKWVPPPEYISIFGIDAIANEISEYLQNEERHHIISLQGIGGIGKTALANHIVRTLAQEQVNFVEIFWVSARQTRLTYAGITGSRIYVSLEKLFDDLVGMMGLTDVKRLSLHQKIDRLVPIFRTNPYLVVM